MLALVALGGLGARRPAALSGGQRQRVALARALINQPEVLLLDEPLGALDLKLRQQMQIELKALQRKVGITFVYVTHDQEEALGMSDRLAVFNLGRIEQIGTPEQIYERPATAFVAGFVGASNIVDAATAERLVGRRQAFSLRPERIRLGLDPTTARRRPRRRRHGDRASSTTAPAPGSRSPSTAAHVLMVDRPNDVRNQVRPEPGQRVRLSWHAAPCSRWARATRHERRRHRAAACAAQTDVRPRAAVCPRSCTAAAGLLTLLLLAPALAWLGIVYLGSLFALLVQSFFGFDDFSGQVVHEFTLRSYAELLTNRANLDIILRTVSMAAAVTLGAALIGFPIAYVMARYATGRAKALFYLAVMLPLWSSYLVRVYAWKLILAKEGVVSWAFAETNLGWLLNGVLALPVIGGPSLSVSYLGMFLVFTYIWLPFMILPTQAALERVPQGLIEASADLGARPFTTFRSVILPLAFPGIVAGSIFTFSLTLGDYIIPYIIGSSRFFIGQAVYVHQGTAGNIPLAAAFSVVPIVIMAVYLTIARRLGAFDAL